MSNRQVSQLHSSQPVRWNCSFSHLSTVFATPILFWGWKFSNLSRCSTFPCCLKSSGIAGLKVVAKLLLRRSASLSNAFNRIPFQYFNRPRPLCFKPYVPCWSTSWWSIGNNLTFETVLTTPRYDYQLGYGNSSSKVMVAAFNDCLLLYFTECNVSHRKWLQWCPFCPGVRGEGIEGHDHPVHSHRRGRAQGGGQEGQLELC